MNSTHTGEHHEDHGITPYLVVFGALSIFTIISFIVNGAVRGEALSPDYVFCDQALLTHSSSRLWRGSWRWGVYEVNDRRRALEVAARGAKLIETTRFRDMLRQLRDLRSRV